MTQPGPPTISFPSPRLPEHVNTTEKGQYRKPPVDLEKCKLMEMIQYRCEVVGEVGQKEVKCKELQRLFRKCAGGLTVETTEWEFVKDFVK